MLSRFSTYFVEVARRRSIRQASDQLNISTSAIDRQILKMEDQLGTRLFDRTTQGLKLTAAGELTLDSVRRWQREVAQLRTQIDDLKGLRRGEISIGVVEGALEFVAALLADFGRTYPGITYDLQIASTGDVTEAVRRGDTEIGVAFPGNKTDVRIEAVMLYRFGLVMPPRHRLADHAELRISECIDCPIIMPDRSMRLREVIEDAWWANGGVKPHVLATAHGITAMKALVRSGMGVSVMSSLDARFEVESGLLAFRPLMGRALPMANYSIFSASGRTLSAPAALLSQYVASAMMAAMSDEGERS